MEMILAESRDELNRTRAAYTYLVSEQSETVQVYRLSHNGPADSWTAKYDWHGQEAFSHLRALMNIEGFRTDLVRNSNLVVIKQDPLEHWQYPNLFTNHKMIGTVGALKEYKNTFVREFPDVRYDTKWREIYKEGSSWTDSDIGFYSIHVFT